MNNKIGLRVEPPLDMARLSYYNWYSMNLIIVWWCVENCFTFHFLAWLRSMMILLLPHLVFCFLFAVLVLSKTQDFTKKFSTENAHNLTELILLYSVVCPNFFVQNLLRSISWDLFSFSSSDKLTCLAFMGELASNVPSTHLLFELKELHGLQLGPKMVRFRPHSESPLIIKFVMGAIFCGS